MLCNKTFLWHCSLLKKMSGKPISVTRNLHKLTGADQMRSIYYKQYLFVTFLIMIIRADLVNEARGATFLENFSSYPREICFADQSTLGKWHVIFHGFGCIKIENPTNPRLHEAPAVSQLPGETHASLVIGPSFAGPISHDALAKRGA